MLTLETSIQQLVKVDLKSCEINDLVAGLPGLGRGLALKAAVDLIEQLQEQQFADLLAGLREAVCERCGIVHSGRDSSVVRRGSRTRRLKTSSGVLVFELHQVTCGDCRRTWSPFAGWLGLKPLQRVAQELERKLVELVTDISYAKTCAIGGEWLGATLTPKTLHRAVRQRGSRVRFTPAAGSRVALVDGTKVPASSCDRGCEIRFTLQILGREEHHGRSRVVKRIAGWSVGAGSWSRAIPAGVATEVIVTDREQGLAEVMRKEHPGVFHAMCEWHLGHTLEHMLLLDRVKNQERKQRVAELAHLVWGAAEKRATAFQELRERVKDFPQASTLLRNVAAYIVSGRRGPERTTSVIEREMREINRRTDVGARWSVAGVDHLLRLRHSRRINPDDFNRVWSTVQQPTFHTVPLA